MRPLPFPDTSGLPDTTKEGLAGGACGKAWCKILEFRTCQAGIEE